MFSRAVLFSLLSLVLIVSATGLECMIYVSSSDGINNTSCWTGGYQTPCATLDLALQGTLTVQDKCSSGTVINLSPGNYTLDTTTLEQQLLRNNVSIIGMRNGSRYEEVNITCLHVSSSLYHWLGYIVFQRVSLYNCNNVPVSCTQPSFDLTTHNAISQELCSNLTLNVTFTNLPLKCYPYYQYSEWSHNYNCKCEHLLFTVSIIDNCNNEQYDWNNKLNVCVATAHTNFSCSNITIQSYYDAAHYDNRIRYVLNNFCLNSFIDPFEVSLYIQTLGLITINISTIVNVTTECAEGYAITDNENCDYNTPCDTIGLKYFLPLNYNDYDYDYDNECCNECCYDYSIYQCLANCTSDTGVPINYLTCVNCEDYPLGILVFILIEILPITLMVILIIILNIQLLTNGSINGVIVYLQIMAIIYSLNNQEGSIAILQLLGAIPCSIFNLDFTPFLINYPLCIAPHMSPLGAISFWYVIGFYPLLLLLLIYVWIILYDKGFQCVVFITRPFHRCMARFWSKTGIEPSLTNSIASIYILSFTQLTATSFKILSFNIGINNSASFFYDQKQGYFHGAHGLACFIAILVLLIVILLPTLYIQFYPFKWFHKLLDCLHLRKQLLISLGDIFTGPYKNGSENTSDYRFMAGLYLWARIITLSLCVLFTMFLFAISFAIACCSFLLALIILIFRPFKRNINSFSEALVALMITALGFVIGIFYSKQTFYAVSGINCFIMFVGVIYATYQMVKICKHYGRKNPVTNNKVQEDAEPIVDNDDDWVADHMENPQEYNEQHVAVRLFEVSEEHHQPIAITTAATYGSINETKT